MQPRTDASPLLLLHVGYHKTATTWLQEHVFDHVGGVEHLTSGQQLWPLLREVKNADAWSPEALVAAVAGCRGDGPALLSYEGLSGNPFRRPSHTARGALRLASAFPGATAVLVVREQSAHLRSLYGQYLQEGGRLSARRWLRSERFDPDHLRFDRAVAAYDRAFGRDRVCVLPYEGLRADRAAFLRAFFASVPGVTLPDGFSDARPRRSPTALGGSVLRRCNLALRRSSHHHDPLIARVAPRPVVSAASVLVRQALQPRALHLARPAALVARLEARQRALFAEAARGYADSNAALAARVEWSPAAHGYALP